MAITHFGNKMLRGTKVDRVVDSLGSSGDGTNSGITLLGVSETLKSSADLDTDFSSNTGWTEVGTGNITIDTGNDRMQYNCDHGGDDDAVVYDLGAGNVSDTAWVLRYKFNMSGSNAPSQYMMPMLSSQSVAGSSNTTIDALGMWFGETGGGTGGAYANIRLSDGETSQGGSYHGNTTSAFSNNTDYYITMKRESATKFTIEIRTGSHTGSHALGSPISATDIPSTVGGLRYICFRDNDGSTHTRYLNSYIYDLEFYNNSIDVSGAKLGSGAYSLNGSSSKVVCGSASDWKFLHDGTANTITFWAKFNDLSQSDPAGIIATNNVGNSSTGLAIFVSNNNQIGYYQTNGSSATQNSQDIYTVTDTDWHHYAFTYDGALANTNLVMYVDGVQKATGNKANTFATGNPSNTLAIGSNNQSSAEYFDGKLDDIGIWKRVLTATEIGKLVNNNVSGASGWDQSGTDHEISGGKLNINAESRGNHRIWYDLGSAKGDSNFVMRFEINLTSYDSNNGGASMTFVTLSDNTDGLTSTNDSLNAFNYSGNGWRQSTADGQRNDSTSDQTSNLGSISAGDTHYMEMKRSGTTYTLSRYSSSAYSGTPTWTNDLSIGSGITGLRYIKVQNGYQGNKVGWIDNIKFWESNTASGSPDVDIPFTAGDAQLVSSLTDKSGLKAYYSMNTQGTASWTGFTKTDDFSLASYETQPRGCTISTDGTYFYVVGDQGHSVDQFTMSTPYDLTTISHTRVQALGTNNPRGIYFKEDGTKMFVSYYGGTIKRYSLSTAWDVSTIGSADQSDTFESDSGDYNSVGGLFFKPDGTKFYTAVASDNAIKQYDCGSAWDVSSMSGSDVATRDSLQGDVTGVFISTDGLRIWYCDYATDKVYQWNLSTAWDITTGSADSTSYSVEANPFGIAMKTDGTKFYLVNDGEDEIQEFTAGKSCPNDFSSTSDLDGMTNLPENTIFLQTDDTPSYWWKQSDNTWKKDPKATVEENFSSSSGWTLSNSAISNNSITCTGSGESYKAITGIGKPDKLTWDFTWTRNSGDAGDTSAFLLTNHTGGYSDPSSGQTNVQFYMPNGNATWLSVRKNSGSGNVQTECNLSSGIQDSGTTKYYRITKDGTLWTVKRFGSASDREDNSNVEDSATATMSSSAVSTWNTGSGDLTYILVDGHGSQAKNYTISDVKIWKDVAL